MKKKLISLLLTAVMVLTLAGCGSEKAATSDSEDVADPSVEEESVTQDTNDTADTTTEEPVTITVWCWDSFNIDAMKTAAAMYTANHPNVTIDVQETVSADIQTLVQTYAMGGQLENLPDVFLMDDQVFAKYLQNYPEVFSELTNSGIDFSQFASAKVANSVAGGKNYGIPYDSNTVIACYRTDYLAQAGYTIEDLTDITWDEFITIGEDVLDKTGMPMLTNVQGEPDLLNMILQSAGISVFDENGNPTLEGNEGLMAATEVYLDLVSKGILQEQIDWSGYQGSINNGSVVGTINGSWICATIRSTDDASQEGQWAVTNMPKLNDYEGATNYSAQGGSTWAISSTTKNYDTVVDFFNETWAGSTDFYDSILTSLGAIGTYLPASGSDVYNQTVDYFGGEAIYSKIVEYGGNIPTINKGIYWFEEKEAMGVAIANVLSGQTTLEAALSEAQSTVEFNIGQ